MFHTNKVVRLFAALVMIGSIIWGQWWLTLILGILFLFIFHTYYEILGWGIVYDALYGVQIEQFNSFPYIFSVAAIILFLFVEILRKILIAYE